MEYDDYLFGAYEIIGRRFSAVMPRSRSQFQEMRVRVSQIKLALHCSSALFPGRVMWVSSMRDRRSLLRLPIGRGALIQFPGIPGAHPCIVENMHFEGACVSSRAYYIFANKFHLSFDGFKTTMTCHVVWKCGGVRFISRRTEESVFVY
jgi:hypothetical protein